MAEAKRRTVFPMTESSWPGHLVQRRARTLSTATVGFWAALVVAGCIDDRPVMKAARAHLRIPAPVPRSKVAAPARRSPNLRTKGMAPAVRAEARYRSPGVRVVDVTLRRNWIRRSEGPAGKKVRSCALLPLRGSFGFV